MKNDLLLIAYLCLQTTFSYTIILNSIVRGDIEHVVRQRPHFFVLRLIVKNENPKPKRTYVVSKNRGLPVCLDNREGTNSIVYTFRYKLPVFHYSSDSVPS